MTARQDPSHLVVGFLQRAHGIKGEIFVKILTDHPGSVFAPGVVLYPGGARDDEPDPDLPPLATSSRPSRTWSLWRTVRSSIISSWAWRSAPSMERTWGR